MTAQFPKRIFLFILLEILAIPCPKLFAKGFSATPGVDLDNCLVGLAQMRTQGKLKLSGNVKVFFEDYFLPVVGRRGLEKPVTQETEALQWEGYPGSKRYRVQFSEDVSKPTLDDKKPGVRTLMLPKKEPFKDLTEGQVKKWLLGHPLHPFMVDPNARVERASLQEPDLFHRQVQLDASRVGKTYLKNGSSRNSGEKNNLF